MSDRPDANAKGADARRSIVRRMAATPSASTPLVTPIQPAVAWRSADADALDDLYLGRAHGYTYAREAHPNADALGAKIDWLEGVTPAMGRGVVAGSGMGALTAMFLGLLKVGDHVVAGDQLYGKSLKLLRHDLPRFGVSATFADPTDARAFAQAIRPETRLILVEVVSNPTLRVADMEGIAALAQAHGALLAVDNTFTTPRAYRPFDHGADIVIHSVTKLLAGHSDATLGWAAATTPERNAAMRDAVMSWGLTPSPFDCWLAERGLHSFDLRFERASANAARLADALAGMKGVAQVLYPGRPDHPDCNRAGDLLQGRFGNMVSFRLKGGRTQANAFLRAASDLPFAPTLGDVATTLSHPASSSHRALSETDRARLGIDEGFIRVSVGIEDADQLIAEFGGAVAAAAQASAGAAAR
ncbi:MAG: trans-sulfuration enzyme family protein [Rubrimonas sp.]